MRGCYVVSHKQIGDLILLEPSLRKLSLSFGCPVYVLTRSQHRPLLNLMQHSKYIGGTPVTVAENLFAYDDLPKTALRSFLAPSLKKTCLAIKTCRSAFWLPAVFQKVNCSIPDNEYLAKFFWKITPGVSHEQFSPPTLNQPPKNWRPKQLQDDHPFILVNPTSGWRRKSWKPYGWVQVIEWLLRSTSVKIVITSGHLPWQREHIMKISAKINNQRLAYLDYLSFENFLWICSRASLVISVDGAAAHLASAFQVPSVTLFGPTNPIHWHFPTKTSISIMAPNNLNNKRLMESISADAVITAAEKLLNKIL